MSIGNIIEQITRNQVQQNKIVANISDANSQFGIFTAQKTVSVIYILTLFDGTIFVDTSGSVASLTLPSAIGLGGRIYTIKDTGNASAFNITILTILAQTIDGVTPLVLTVDFQSVMLQSNGVNWLVIASH